MRWMMLVCLFGLLASAGCDRREKPAAAIALSKGYAKKADSDAMSRESAPREEATGQHPPGAPDPAPPNAPAAQGEKGKVEKPRKIKYTANLQVIVEDFTDSVKQLQSAIKAVNGLKAHEEINNSPNAIRTGTWRVRVAEDQLDDFRDAVKKIGKAERDTLDSEDMTAQFYDLEEHIKNRKSSRESMRELLKKTGDRDMQTHLLIVDKLDRLTDEINREEGKLRLWANLTDLTTVTVTLREQQKYIAEKGPELTEVPTFGVRAEHTFSRSWETFVSFLQGVALFAIAITPWLPVLLIPSVIVWLTARSFRARPAATVKLVEPATSAQVTPPAPG